MDGNITSAGTLSGTLTAEQTLSGGITRAEREIVGVLDVEVDGVSVVTDSVASIDLTGKADVSSLATVATTGDYDDLTNKPVEVFIAEYGVTTYAEVLAAYNAGKVVFVKDGVRLASVALNYYSGTAKFYAYYSEGVESIGSYQLDSGGWTKLRTFLVPTYRKVNDKALSDNITLTASDVGALPSDTSIPSNLSDLTNDMDVSDFPNDAGYLTSYTETDPVFTASAAHGIASSDITAWNGKQDALVSGTNIKTINNESILGSGNITIQGGGGTVTDVEIDETSIVTDGVAEIPHATNNTYGVVKATNIVAGNTSTGETYTYGQITYGNGSNLNLAATALATTSKRGLMSKDDKTKLDGIATGAEANVQSDWNESDSASDAYIANKPTIPTVPTNVSAFTNDAGYLTSYTETDPTVPSWAKASSKPSYTFSEIGTTPTSISGYGITDAYTKSEIDGLVSGVLHYKGTKATTSALPSSGNTTGDVWHVTADGSEWAWDGTQWQELGTAVDLSGYVPTSRTVNGKALSSNISLTASDVSALPSSTVIPTVNNATLTIQKNGTTVNTFTANASSDVTANISVPTKVSDLTNDSGFLTLATLPIYNGGVQ